MTKQAHLKIKHLLIAVAELMWSFFFPQRKDCTYFEAQCKIWLLKPYDGAVAEDVLQM